MQQWLRNSGSARVLHLFKEVCTLANERDEVISLVSPAVGLGPFTAVLSGGFTSGLDVRQLVTLDGARQTLTVGTLIVDAGDSAIWQPKPNWSRLQSADIAKWPPVPALPSNIAGSLKLTIKGILANDPVTCMAGVESLAGRGRGLTPTGDDVLVGILYGLWVWYPHYLPRPREEWMEMIVKAAVPRTTTLSANFIQAACDGEAIWQWHDLVNGCPYSIERILSIGHTSGADALAGLMYTGFILRSTLGNGES